MAAIVVDALAAPLRAAMTEVAQRFNRDGIPFVVGGSAMLACRGLGVPVGDLDICTRGDQLNRVLAALEGCEPVVWREPAWPWQSSWLVRAELNLDPSVPGGEATGGVVAVDVIGDLAIEVGGEVARFPVVAADVVELGGVPVPFDSMWRWYHVYRIHDPAKATRIAALAATGVLEKAAVEVGLPTAF
jgi:hypothetical protein